MSSVSVDDEAPLLTRRTSGRRSSRGSALGNVVGPVIAFVVVIGLWEVAVRSGIVSSFEVPRPSAIGKSMWAYLTSGWHDPQDFYHNLWASVSAAAIGLGGGALLGVAFAVAVSESKILDKLLRPYVVGVQGIPKVALAPLLGVWFGFSSGTKVVLVLLLTMFPVWVHTLDGLQRTPPGVTSLFKLHGVSRLGTFRRIKVFYALPQFFVGLNLSAILSLVGVVVFEFVGSSNGLGTMVLRAREEFELADMFALFVIMSILGLALYYLTAALARKVVYWEHDADKAASR